MYNIIYMFSKDTEKLITLLIVCFLLIVISGYVAFLTEQEKNPNLTVANFIGIYPFPSINSILVGMAANFVFGLIDNGGLWFGMDALDPFLVGSPLAKSGFGNAFSDGLGAFLGTFAGIIIKNKFAKEGEEPPLWAEAFGIVLGCLLVVFIMEYVIGSNKIK